MILAIQIETLHAYLERFLHYMIREVTLTPQGVLAVRITGCLGAQVTEVVCINPMGRVTKG